MRHFKLLGTALAAALMLAACGGGGNGDQSPAVAYTSVVSFGDSLSDAGSYQVGPIVALHGGLFTVNGITGAIGNATPPSYTWAQLIAAQAVGSPNCAARTGGFGVPVATVSGCTNYAQGGARVTDPAGSGNQGQTSGVFNAAMTVPVVTQVTNYLADVNNGGKFTGKELVTVLAGANDILAQTDLLEQGVVHAAGTALVTSLVTQLVAGLAPANQATAVPAIQTAAGTAVQAAIATEAAKSTATLTSIITAATQAGTTAAGTAAATDAATNSYVNANLANITTTIPATAGQAAATAANTYATTTGATNAVTGMVTAANQLVASVKGMVANGATHVVVSNLPDVSQTPMALAQSASSQQLILAMTTNFNQALAAGLAGTPGVLVVDVFSEHQRELKDPAHFALTNVTATACNLDPSVNPLSSSLVCNANNLITGDTTHYMYADSLHPTPYEHKLLAQYVAKAMVIAGWL